MDEEPAPFFTIPEREVFALEHPMVIRNLDKAIQTFGRNRPFLRILDSTDPEECIPLYLRINDPMCVPILSHNSPTNNVLLRITVPKRTGRKRKRGSQDPFTYSNGSTIPPEGHEDAPCDEEAELRSQYGMDKPSVLLRKIMDNKDNYDVEAVAEIRQSHRYRGLSDFHYSATHTKFMPKFLDQFLSGEASKLRQFQFDPQKGWNTNEEMMPPPKFTIHAAPQNWGWHQNPNIFMEVDEETGGLKLVNRSKPRKTDVPYLKGDIATIPPSSPFPLPNDPELRDLIGVLQKVLDERPVWTRRALMNKVYSERMARHFRNALQYVAYQFRGGPFRDAVIRYGVDPRSEKKYREFQTLFFQFFSDEDRVPGRQWHDMRTTYSQAAKEDDEGYMFDGKSVSLGGKVWQVCDITDPLLLPLIHNSPYRDVFDVSTDGWYTNGTMAKLRAIMRTKVMALRMEKEVTDEDFAMSLAVDDIVPGKHSAQIPVPVPDIAPTAAEINDRKLRGETTEILGGGIKQKAHKGKSRSVRIRPRVGKDQAKAPELRTRRGRPAITKKWKAGTPQGSKTRPERPSVAANGGNSEAEEDEETTDDSELEEGMNGRPASSAQSGSATSGYRHNAGGGLIATVNGMRYIPAPPDLSMYRTLAPRPPPSK